MAATVEKIKKMVDSLFSDTTCSREETKECLEEIVEHIEMYLDTLD